MCLADGVQPLTVHGILPANIDQWQQVVPTYLLTVGFGALYAAWGSGKVLHLKRCIFNLK